MKILSTTLFISLFLSGCAGVKFYNEKVIASHTNSNSSKTLTETGIPFYPPKPYLLITKTGAKEKPVEATVIYLPNMHEPIYAVPRSGFGSATMNMGFSNGILTTFGQATDPKITELITSLAGVPGLLANAAKTRAETTNIRNQSSDAPTLSKKIGEIASSLTKLKTHPGYSTAFNALNTGKIDQVEAGLQKDSADLVNPFIPKVDISEQLKKLEGYAKALDDITPSPIAPQGEAANAWNQLNTTNGALKKLISDEKPKPESEPVAVLYEIIIEDGKTKLKEVGIETIKQ